MATAFKGLVMRSGKISFMKLSSETGTGYKRMTHFTEMNKSMNPQEYSRNYVDIPSEVTDVTGYSPNISFAFDRYQGDEVQEDIIKVFDNEDTGTDAVREILTVDMTTKTGAGQYKGLLRKYSIIPDSEGDGTDAYTYSGSFTSNGEQTKVDCTLNEDETEATVVTQAAAFSEETRSGRYR